MRARDAHAETPKPNFLRYLIISTIPIILIVAILLIEQYVELEHHPLLLFAVIPLLVISILVLSFSRSVWSIRHIQAPAWRWIAGGCKGEIETDLPRMFTRAQVARAKGRRNRRQRIYHRLGGILGLLATIPIIAFMVIRYGMNSSLRDHPAVIGLMLVSIVMMFASGRLVKMGIPRDILDDGQSAEQQNQQ